MGPTSKRVSSKKEKSRNSQRSGKRHLITNKKMNSRSFEAYSGQTGGVCGKVTYPLLTSYEANCVVSNPIC